jgi:hypothetical protein
LVTHEWQTKSNHTKKEKKTLVTFPSLLQPCYVSKSFEKIIIVATPLWPSVGVKLNTCKVGDLESSGTPECLELDSTTQNTSHWGVLGVIGKVLKHKY